LAATSPHPVRTFAAFLKKRFVRGKGRCRRSTLTNTASPHWNFGVKYETTALQPVIGVAFLPWRDPATVVPCSRSFRTFRPSEYFCAIAPPAVSRSTGGPSISHYSFRILIARIFVVVSLALHASWKRPARAGFSHRMRSGAVTRLAAAAHSIPFRQAMDSAGWDSGGWRSFSCHIQGTARLGARRNLLPRIRRRSLGSSQPLRHGRFCIPLGLRRQSHDLNRSYRPPKCRRARSAEELK